MSTLEVDHTSISEGERNAKMGNGKDGLGNNVGGCDSIVKYVPFIRPLRRLQFQFRPSPVSALAVIPNFIPSPHSEPHWNRTVLSPLFGELQFDPKVFMGGHGRKK